jgi:hypothetical protein
VKFCFWPLGRHATALRPAWGSALQPGGRGSRARPLLCLEVTYLRGCPSAAGASIDADIAMSIRGGWWRGAVRPLMMRQGSANSPRTTLRTARSARALHTSIFHGTSVNVVLALQVPPMRGTGITNAECELVIHALATDRPGCLECQVHGTRRTCRTDQVSHGRMVWPS